MNLLLVFVLLETFLVVNSERHSLTYIYTALSKRVENPGIHEFTAMGLLDTKMIEYFDSDLQKKVPKQEWMKERFDKEYWDKGTEEMKNHQQWFKKNLDILKDQMNQTNENIHVLQQMHGCEADLLEDGKMLQFHRSIDKYVYNDNTFLYFDYTHSVWVVVAKEAELIERKRDDVQVLMCLDWLNKFKDYSKQQLIHAAPPDVYVFANSAKRESNAILTCMATGFYPPDIVLNIKMNGRVLTEEDGVWTTGIRPNQDDTYQLRKSIEILRTDVSTYTCEVSHAATAVSITEIWNGKLPNTTDSNAPPIGLIVGIVCFLLIIGLVFFILGVSCGSGANGPSPNSSSDGSSNGSTDGLPKGSENVLANSAQSSTQSNPSHVSVEVPLMENCDKDKDNESHSSMRVWSTTQTILPKEANMSYIGARMESGNLPEVSLKSLDYEHISDHNCVLLLLLPLQRARGNIHIINY